MFVPGNRFLWALHCSQRRNATPRKTLGRATLNLNSTHAYESTHILIVGPGAVTDTGHRLQISLLGRFNVGHSLVLLKICYFIGPTHATDKDPGSTSIIPFFLCATCLQRHVKPLHIIFRSRYYALLGSHGNTVTIPHPDEPHMQKYVRFGEAPAPRSRTCLKDAALQNLLPHLYPARIRILRENAKAETTKPRTEDRKRAKEHSPTNGEIDRRESYHLPQISEPDRLPGQYHSILIDTEVPSVAVTMEEITARLPLCRDCRKARSLEGRTRCRSRAAEPEYRQCFSIYKPVTHRDVQTSFRMWSA